jgi:hypothetical protein
VSKIFTTKAQDKERMNKARRKRRRVKRAGALRDVLHRLGREIKTIGATRGSGPGGGGGRGRTSSAGSSRPQRRPQQRAQGRPQRDVWVEDPGQVDVGDEPLILADDRPGERGGGPAQDDSGSLGTEGWQVEQDVWQGDQQLADDEGHGETRPGAGGEASGRVGGTGGEAA